MTAVLRWPTIATERDVNQPRMGITDSRDVARLVNVFCDRVREDDVLGPIFDDIAQVDWATHLPRMDDFGESVLFGRATFKGTPLRVHRALDRRTPLTSAAFDRWIALFQSTVDDLFSGQWQNTPRILPCESRPPWSTTSVRGRRPLTPRL